MDRRAFFKTLVGGVAAAAAVREFPFRVFSFPSEIKISEPQPLVWLDGINKIVWYVNPDQAAALEALQLEVVREEIPKLFENGKTFYSMLRKRSLTWKSVQDPFRFPLSIGLDSPMSDDLF